MQKASFQDRTLTKTGTPGIYKRGSRYCVIFRDSTGKQRKRSARTLAEARNLKATLTADVRRGEYRELSKVTFGEYAEEWIKTYQGRTSRGLREETRAEYRRNIEMRAVPFFGRMRLAEIEPRDVKRYATTVAAEGVAANTVRLAVAPVKALLATAVEDGLIRSNPAAGLRLRAALAAEGESETQRVKALTRNELRRLLETVDPDRRLIVDVLVTTGLRISECVALRWSDIDLTARTLTVRRRWYKGSFASPKSSCGRRSVPLSPSLAQRLGELWRESRSGGDALVFPGRAEGQPIAPSTVFRAVRSAAVRAGVPWAGPHTLRHTCASLLFDSGLNVKQVQAWLGHHKASFTLDVYVHLLADELPEAAFFDALIPAPEGATVGATRVTETGRDATPLRSVGTA